MGSIRFFVFEIFFDVEYSGSMGSDFRQILGAATLPEPSSFVGSYYDP